MRYHEKILLSDALQTAIENEKKNIRLKRLLVIEGVVCVLAGILIGWLI